MQLHETTTMPNLIRYALRKLIAAETFSARSISGLGSFGVEDI